MRINLITVGKIKEAYLRDAIAEYAKRLSSYCRLNVLEVADEKTPDGASEALCRQIKDREGERILGKIGSGSYVIVLAIQGEMLSSEGLAAQLNQLMVRGISEITFVIGGSLGLSERVMQRANYSLSFSKMTFPHQLMRVILLEQIYRSFRINANEPYHK